jgi:predicted transposase/invertase (TIGR01784 family)
MKLGISPIVNYAFIMLFASEENEPVLRAFLNAILKLEHPIVSLRVLHPFNMQEFEDDKQSILDVKATDSLGRIFNIEMQLSNHSAFVPRIVFYGCELYADQLREGDDYTERNRIFRRPTKRSVGYTCCFMHKITNQRV